MLFAFPEESFFEVEVDSPRLLVKSRVIIQFGKESFHLAAAILG